MQVLEPCRRRDEPAYRQRLRCLRFNRYPPHEERVPQIAEMLESRSHGDHFLQVMRVRAHVLEVHDRNVAHLGRHIVQLRHHELQRPVLQRRLFVQYTTEVMRREQSCFLPGRRNRLGQHDPGMAIPRGISKRPQLGGDRLQVVVEALDDYADDVVPTPLLRQSVEAVEQLELLEQSVGLSMSSWTWLDSL